VLSSNFSTTKKRFYHCGPYEGMENKPFKNIKTHMITTINSYFLKLWIYKGGTFFIPGLDESIKEGDSKHFPSP
jgi:hypothetical protein